MPKKTKTNDRELIAKAVFGEITLGEVIGKFESSISSIFVERDGEDLGNFDSWAIEEGHLQLLSEHAVEADFLLDSRVKVHESWLELEKDGVVWTLSFLEYKKVRFDSILSGAAK